MIKNINLILPTKHQGHKLVPGPYKNDWGSLFPSQCVEAGKVGKY